MFEIVGYFKPIRRQLRSLSRLPVTWTLADQAAVSLGAFLSNLFLARALTPAEYGEFALIFSVALFLNNVVWAVVAYPLTIRGAASDESGLRNLTVEALCVGGILSMPIAVIVLFAAFLARDPGAGPFAVAAVGSWQLQETLRRALLAHMRHRTAVWGDGLSYLGQAGLVWLLVWTGGATVRTAFAAMAITSAAAAVIQILQLGLRLPRSVPLRGALSTAWRMGRWLMLTNLVSGIGFQTFPWVLALSRGPAETAAFQAIANAVNVTNPVAFSIVNHLVPAAARANHDKGILTSLSIGLRYLALGGAMVSPYLAILVVWPDWILSTLYGQGSPYGGLAVALRVAAVATVFSYTGGVLAALLMSLKENRMVFASQLAAAAGFGVAVPLIIGLGVTGAYLGVLCTHLIRLVYTVRQVEHIRRRPSLRLSP